jgi:hypothetical protein
VINVLSSDFSVPAFCGNFVREFCLISRAFLFFFFLRYMYFKTKKIKLVHMSVCGMTAGTVAR